MIISTYDSLTAISTFLSKNNHNLAEEPIKLLKVSHVGEDRLFMQTANYGDFMCKSFEDDDANIFMEVHEVYEACA